MTAKVVSGFHPKGHGQPSHEAMGRGEHHVHEAHRRREQGTPRAPGPPEIARVASEADVARRDLQGPAQDELPDEEEGHEPSPGARAVALAQVEVASPRTGQGRPQLAPDHPVRDHDEQADQPAQHGLRAQERGHEQGNRDEGADPDHVGHVEGGGLEEPEATGQVALAHALPSRRMLYDPPARSGP
jgi:hypothetical protein